MRPGIIMLLIVLMMIAGFIIGFIVGRGTREGISSATSVDFQDGVLTASIDTSAALKQGFQSLFR